MPYYRGDYVGSGRGNYYRGDPFLGGLIAGAAGAIGKLGGKAVKWAVKQATGSPKTTAVVAAAAPMLPSFPVPGTGITVNPGSFLPGGNPLFEFGGKKKYRRMNPLNPKALRRALRRAEGFEKFAARTVNALYKNVNGRRTRTFKKC